MSDRKKTGFTSELTSNIAKLANIKIEKSEEGYLTKQFNETLKVIENLDRIKTENVPETSQVTGLTNILREDMIEQKRVLSQKQALSNSKETHEGFFVVKAVFENES